MRTQIPEMKDLGNDLGLNYRRAKYQQSKPVLQFKSPSEMKEDSTLIQQNKEKKNQGNDRPGSKILKKSNQIHNRVNLKSRNKGSQFLITLNLNQTPSLSSKTSS